jgi:hypothetical protein
VHWLESSGIIGNPPATTTDNVCESDSFKRELILIARQKFLPHQLRARAKTLHDICIANALGLWNGLAQIGELNAVFPNKSSDCLPPDVCKEEAVEIKGCHQEGNPNLKLSLFKGNEEEITCCRVDGTVGENLAQVPNPLFNIEVRSIKPLEHGRSMSVYHRESP